MVRRRWWVIGAALAFMAFGAVGDYRSGSTIRVVTAVGEGAAAVSSVHAILGGH